MFTSPIHIDTHDTQDLFCIIRALDRGITHHESWFSLIHQSLICDSPHSNPDDLRDDAHCCCKFGQWLYGVDTDTLKSLDSFIYVVETHEKMHDLAKKLLIKSDNNEKIAESEYRNFTSQTKDFKLNVRNLQYKLMSQICIVDHLTGAWNRHVMYARLHQEKEKLLRAGYTCSICMLDIDYFKRINDTHGHIAGDQVLKAVTEFCISNLREYDSIYRYSGEEFLICLPDAEQIEVKTIIDRLCVRLRDHAIVLADGVELSVTASFGVACLDQYISIEDSIQAADHALLCAKAKGRDRVCFWDIDFNSFQ